LCERVASLARRFIGFGLALIFSFRLTFFLSHSEDWFVPSMDLKDFLSDFWALVRD